MRNTTNKSEDMINLSFDQNWHDMFLVRFQGTTS